MWRTRISFHHVLLRVEKFEIGENEMTHLPHTEHLYMRIYCVYVKKKQHCTTLGLYYECLVSFWQWKSVCLLDIIWSVYTYPNNSTTFLCSDYVGNLPKMKYPRTQKWFSSVRSVIIRLYKTQSFLLVQFQKKRKKFV